MTETYQNLKKLVSESAETIENYAKDNEKYEEKFNELMEDVFDYGVVKKVRHYYNLEPTFVGVEVVLYYGGPTVYVDTEDKVVIGTWGLESYNASLTKEAVSVVEDYVNYVIK